MDIQIIDGMKKEGRPFRNLMIFGYILTVLAPLFVSLINNEKYIGKDIVLFVVTWFMFGSIGLYGWLYALKYRVEFYSDKILLKTLFRRVELNICDIEEYTCNRYNKSVFYQFNLFIKGKTHGFKTHLRPVFIEAIQGHTFCGTLCY